MTTHDLAPFVTTFFTRHLPAERNASPHTIAAYRDTLKLLLRFLAASMHRSAAALHVEDLTPDRILAFLGRPRDRSAQHHSHAQRPARRHPQLLPLRARLRARPRVALSTRARHPREEGATSRARLPQRYRAGARTRADRSLDAGRRTRLPPGGPPLRHRSAHPGTPGSGSVRCPIRPTPVCPALRKGPARTAHAPAAANRSAGATLPRRGRTPRR